MTAKDLRLYRDLGAIAQFPIAQAAANGRISHMRKPVLSQLNIVGADLRRTADFYGHLGIDLLAPCLTAAGEPFHMNHTTDSGMLVEADTPQFARMWNEAWADNSDLSGRVVIGFKVEDRAEVDQVYETIRAAGYEAIRPPFDAFWGARYAIVQDPDGIAVGIMSPVDDQHRSAPPIL
jgi:uncharacterized glyoxalase superfamily protein PhnB